MSDVRDSTVCQVEFAQSLWIFCNVPRGKSKNPDLGMIELDNQSIETPTPLSLRPSLTQLILSIASL